MERSDMDSSAAQSPWGTAGKAERVYELLYLGEAVVAWTECNGVNRDQKLKGEGFNR